MAAKSEVKMVTIPKEEYDEMVRQNQENAEMINQVAGDLDKVRSAQLAGVGIDPKISARATLGRKTVQFNRHYSAGANPSKIQKGLMIMEAYAVSCGDIVHIREDEFKRINEDFPDLMEANPNKFQDKLRLRPQQVVDKTNMSSKIEMVNDPQPVKVLLENAYEVG